MADPDQNSRAAAALNANPANRLAPATGSGAGRGKIWLFRLTALVAAPVITFALLEWVLRLAGYGYPAAFLLKDSTHGRKAYVQNSQFTWRFFGERLARPPYPLFFPQTKPPQTVRIFVFGESAAMGDPLPVFGLSRMLEALLSLRYPGVHFEVENAATTGINSHAIVPITRDCARADGDLWVVYMGNNEVVGPFGAGTVFGRQVPPLSLIRASLWFKSTRTGELLDGIRGRIQTAAGKGKDWNGMEMFMGQQVGAEDPRMNRVYHHFERNLTDIIEAGKRSRVGVVLSTVAVNLKDCPPLASAHRAGLSESDQSKWEQLYALGARAQDAGSNAAAAGFFQEAAGIDDRFAELRFRQGQCALALGKIPEARRHFATARDLDTLRFRCDSRLNDLIRKAAAGGEQDRIRLADAERALGEQSQDGLPGEDLFYEHVHLTFEGNYLLARTVADQLEKLLPSWVTAPGGRRGTWPSVTDCAQRLAWSDWSRAEALRQMLGRISQPPFPGQLAHEARIQRLQTTLEALEPATEPAGIDRTMKSCEQALAAAPDDPSLYAQLTMLKISSGDFVGAEEAAKRQVELLPSNPVGWTQLGMMWVRMRRVQEALAAFDSALEAEPQNLTAMQDRATILLMTRHLDQGIREYQRLLRIHPGYSPGWITLGQIYEQTGRREQAEECFRKALADNVDATMTSRLAKFCQSRGWLEAAATNYEAAVKLEPTDVGLRQAAGQNLLDLQRYGPAAAEFREVLRLKPDLPEPRVFLGIALTQQGRLPEAAAQFEEVLRRDPTNAAALKYARDLREKLGLEQTP